MNIKLLAVAQMNGKEELSFPTSSVLSESASS
jgi:hypothetical protein